MWEETEYNNELFIDIIGHNEASETVMARVLYRPWFFVNCFTREVAEEMVSDINNLCRGGIISSDVMERRRAHGYTLDDKLYCVKFRVRNMMMYRYARKLCTRDTDDRPAKGAPYGKTHSDHRYEYYMYKGKHKVQLEFDISHAHKFRLDNSFSSCGWIVLREAAETNSGTRFAHEYSVRSDMIESVHEPSKVPSIPPVVNPKLFSFDCEMYSSQNKFPDANNPFDEIYLITVCFWNGKNESPEVNYAITHHSDHNYIVKENEVLLRTTDEIDSINTFFKLIVDLDADVLLGHNVFDFDNRYIDIRLGNRGIPYPDISRYIGDSCDPDEKSWDSSARKGERIFFFKCKGRLWFDTLQYTRIYHKMRSYSLKALGKAFLNVQKIDLSAAQQFECYRKKDITPVIEYGIRDAVIPIKLFRKLECWLNITSDANIRDISIFDIYTRGQGYGVLSQEYTKSYKNGYFLSPFKRSSYNSNTNSKKEKFKGATVLEAKVGLYRNVLHADFQGLYPSIMMAFNLCYSTLVEDPDIPDDMCHVFDVPNKNGVTRRVRFIKKEYREGIIPQFLRENKEARSAIKAMMENVPYKSSEWQVLNIRQNNIKLSSNGTYGDKSSNMSKTPCREAGECTTYIGRTSLAKVVEIVQNRYHGKIIYGDSDSIRPHIPILIKRNTGLIDFVQIQHLIPMPESTSTGQEFFDVTPYDIDVWSDVGWTKIKYIMRHKNTKRLYRVSTRTGVVEVTEDHSLLSQSGNEITPNEIGIGSSLLHKDLPNVEACDMISSISNTLKAAFLRGWCDASRNGCIDVEGHVEAARMFYILSSLGYYPSIRTKDGDVYELAYGTDIVLESDVVREIVPLGALDEYVYDIETENHHFAAGVGRMVVHNSVLFNLPYLDDVIKGRVDLINKVGKNITDDISKEFVSPMKLDFEQWWEVYFLVSKKNYAGIVSNPKQPGVVDYSRDNRFFQAKGICLVKRDVPIFVQNLYFDMLVLIFKKSTYEEVEAVYKKYVDAIPHNDYQSMSHSLSIGRDYVSETCTVFLFVKNMQLKHNLALRTGDRYECVILRTQKQDDYVGNKLEILSYAEEQKMKLDYQYYAQICFKKCRKLIELAYPSNFQQFKDLSKHYDTLYA